MKRHDLRAVARALPLALVMGSVALAASAATFDVYKIYPGHGEVRLGGRTFEGQDRTVNGRAYSAFQAAVVNAERHGGGLSTRIGCLALVGTKQAPNFRVVARTGATGVRYVKDVRFAPGYQGTPACPRPAYGDE